MATTCYFEEIVKDQVGKSEMSLEIGRSSFYEEDSVYIRVDDRTVIMDRTTTQRFCEAVQSVRHYHGFLN